MFPSMISMILSAKSKIRGSWVTNTTVIPSLSTNERRRVRISIPLAESRFPVGSSANKILGSLTRALQMATRCFAPPKADLDNNPYDHPNQPNSITPLPLFLDF